MYDLNGYTFDQQMTQEQFQPQSQIISEPEQTQSVQISIAEQQSELTPVITEIEPQDQVPLVPSSETMVEETEQKPELPPGTSEPDSQEPILEPAVQETTPEESDQESTNTNLKNTAIEISDEEHTVNHEDDMNN
jgi:hypothetical protein